MANQYIAGSSAASRSKLMATPLFMPVARAASRVSFDGYRVVSVIVVRPSCSVSTNGSDADHRFLLAFM